jgi:hypothetical protein
MRSRIAGRLICFLAVQLLAATPAITPLPQLMQTRPGVFTLCPSQPVPSISTMPATQILVDSASLETGQYLAAVLPKSTGYQFQGLTNAGTSPMKGAILLTDILMTC